MSSGLVSFSCFWGIVMSMGCLVDGLFAFLFSVLCGRSSINLLKNIKVCLTWVF